MKELLLVGCGGFVGSVGRYLIAGWVQKLSPFTTFPIGTMAVNVLGCFAIGCLGACIDVRQMLGPETRLLLMVGMLGGFTTFSTFSYETLALFRDAEVARGLANAGLHMILCLVAAWLGYAVARP